MGIKPILIVALIILVIAVAMMILRKSSSYTYLDQNKDYAEIVEGKLSGKLSPKLIVVTNAKYELVKNVISNFVVLYSQDKPLKIRFNTIEVDTDKTAIIFSEEMDSDLFIFLVNYIKYPFDVEYEADVRGWETISDQNAWARQDLAGLTAMYFIAPNDKNKDHVWFVTSKNKTFDYGFAAGDGLRDFQDIYSYERPPYDPNRLTGQRQHIIRFSKK